MRTANQSRPRGLKLSLALLTLALLLLFKPAQAGYKFWVGGSGQWDVADNWTPAGVPQDGDDVFLVNGDGLLRIVTYKTPYPSAVLNSLTISAIGSTGLMILNQTNSNYPLKSKNEYVGGFGTIWAFSGRGWHKQSTCSNTIFGNLYLGYNANSEGTYYLSGTGILSANREYIGLRGLGQFYQSGGTNTVSDKLILGYHTGSYGTYKMDGNGYLSTNRLQVGFFGEGEFKHYYGTVNISGSLSVGVLNGSRGMYELHQFSNDNPSSLSAPLERIGVYGRGSFELHGGTNTVNGDVIVGFWENSHGTYYTTGGKHTSTNLFVGYYGEGEFHCFLWPDIKINDALFLGYRSSGKGVFVLAGDGRLEAARQYIGFDGVASFEHRGGKIVFMETSLWRQMLAAPGYTF